jgi:hypothetical protein
MKIEIEPTAEFTTIDGRRCRVWKGQTENGTPCRVFVTLIAVATEHDQREFKQHFEPVTYEEAPAGYRIPFIGLN